jgi:hypothetical protein
LCVLSHSHMSRVLNTLEWNVKNKCQSCQNPKKTLHSTTNNTSHGNCSLHFVSLSCRSTSRLIKYHIMKHMKQMSKCRI